MKIIKLMQYKRKILVICFLSCFSCLLHAQDIHFSQFYSCPLFTNAANTGNFDDNFRFVLNGKNQWNSFTNAYKTYATSFDYGVDNLFLKSSRAGLGLQLNNDVSGDGNFSTTQICLNSAYYLPFKKKIKIGLGTKLAYVLHTINQKNFKFGNQYVNDGFSESEDSEEFLNFNKESYPDFGIGTNIIYKYNSKISLQTGFMADHIFNPTKSFYNNSESFLPIKWSVIVQGEIELKQDFWLEPHFISLFQQKFREYNIGGIFRYDYNPVGVQSLYFGTSIRARDAGIVVFGLKYKDIKLLINYDINMSKLSTISRGKGGTEFSIIYSFSKTKPIKSPYYRKCPDFF